MSTDVTNYENVVGVILVQSLEGDHELIHQRGSPPFDHFHEKMKYLYKPCSSSIVLINLLTSAMFIHSVYTRNRETHFHLHIHHQIYLSFKIFLFCNVFNFSNSISH